MLYVLIVTTRHAVNFINYGNYDMKTGIGIESPRGQCSGHEKS